MFITGGWFLGSGVWGPFHEWDNFCSLECMYAVLPHI